MSSSLGFLAYSFVSAEPAHVTRIRLQKTEEHLQQIHHSPLQRTHVGDQHSGFVGWLPSDSSVDWDFFSTRGQVGTAWLHVPSLAGGPETGNNAWSLADDVFHGALHQGDLGAPFVVARWDSGVLDIANDMLGLVRLFHYKFDGGDVWSTRQGLAHIFMGEEPQRNDHAWAGMATVGWANGGETQLGYGKQVLGGTRVRAGRDQNGRYVEEHNCFAQWVQQARSHPLPSTAQNVHDMELLMSTARRWPLMATADLSGGKDSRVCAALGIRAGAISAVQTINTDFGEVDTAKTLMSTVGEDIQHHILQKQPRVNPSGRFLDRIYSQHRAYEGRYLAATAINSAKFSKFKTASQARFNGLGGEVLGGGNFSTGNWRAKMLGAPTAAAGPRLERMVRSNNAASNAAKDLTVGHMKAFSKMSEEVGATTAGEILDMLYARDRMPNWSVNFTTAGVLCPLFAPSLLTISAHTMGAPVPDGELHRELLRTANPAWAEVPFYTPTTMKTRSTPFIWEDEDWSDVETFIRERVDGATAFDPDHVIETLERIRKAETLGKAEEVIIFRFLWDQTFDKYVDNVAMHARAVKNNIAIAVHS